MEIHPHTDQIVEEFALFLYRDSVGENRKRDFDAQIAIGEGAMQIARRKRLASLEQLDELRPAQRRQDDETLVINQ